MLQLNPKRNQLFSYFVQKTMLCKLNLKLFHFCLLSDLSLPPTLPSLDFRRYLPLCWYYDYFLFILGLSCCYAVREFSLDLVYRFFCWFYIYWEILPDLKALSSCWRCSLKTRPESVDETGLRLKKTTITVISSIESSSRSQAATDSFTIVLHAPFRSF